MVIVRSTEFYAYRNTEGVEVMATEIKEAVQVHLQVGLVPYEVGDYEVITAEGKCVYMHKEEFESLFKSIETKETLTLHGVDESPDGEKEGGD